MTNTGTSNDVFARSLALEKALRLYETRAASPDQVVQAAEKFRVFLAGEDAKPGLPKAAEAFMAVALPNFELPYLWDDFLYYQFENSTILYRANVHHGAMAPGGVERINAQYETRWAPVTESKVDTREKLRTTYGYSHIPSMEAAEILRRAVKGVRFE